MIVHESDSIVRIGGEDRCVQDTPEIEIWSIPTCFMEIVMQRNIEEGHLNKTR